MVRIMRRRRRRGTAAVEAAMMLPLIALMTFALIKYGWLYVKVQQINNAARHGARVAVRADATNGDVDAAIEALMDKVWLAGAGDPPANWYVVTYEPANVDGLDTGTIVTITIAVTYAGTPLDIMAMPLVPVPDVIAGTASMAKEGT